MDILVPNIPPPTQPTFKSRQLRNSVLTNPGNRWIISVSLHKRLQVREGQDGDILVEDVGGGLYKLESWHSVNASNTPNSSHGSWQGTSAWRGGIFIPKGLAYLNRPQQFLKVSKLFVTFIRWYITPFELTPWMWSLLENPSLAWLFSNSSKLCMEPEGSLPYSQEPATGLHPEPEDLVQFERNVFVGTGNTGGLSERFALGKSGDCVTEPRYFIVLLSLCSPWAVT
jgi:hypothetical protein